MEAPSRNLALDLVRVTEAAALAAARWLGRGDKQAGDQAAVEHASVLTPLILTALSLLEKGKKTNLLYNGEKIGTGKGSAVDVAVDPVEGTNLLAFWPSKCYCCYWCGSGRYYA